MTDWKAEAREHKNKAHTWRILYQDLLQKIAYRLDIEHDRHAVMESERSHQ